MNVDARDSVLNSHICFNALATLQHIKNVENSCNFCSSSDHSTYLCPVLSQGEHVKDTSIDNLSRSSVPHGLQVFENETGQHIISVQKFAKGCRFGPLLAPKSYIPITNTKFPLTIFGTINLDMDAMNMPELKELFQVRNIYLDTRNEKYCNWMIHVDPAQCSNEQNLIAYEEDNEIFFAAIEDLDVGDILKVWYAPKYGERMNVAPLRLSMNAIVKNVLHQGGGMLPEFQLLNNFLSYENQPNRTEISLPPIKSIIKPSSYVCYENRTYTPACLPSLTTIPSDNMPYNNTSIDHINGSDHDSSLGLDNNILNLDDRLAFTAQIHTAGDLFGSFEDEDDEQLKNTHGPNVIKQELVTVVTATTTGLSSTEKDDKKIYPCQLCDKKYSTMTNIYRHVRTQHNYFLCSLCMNMFQLETDLKEHIHKCPKSDVKKPQCMVCMQYFSNSWSLTRHIKIHVSAGECNADILVDRKIKEKKPKEESKDGIDFSDIEKNSRDSLVNELINMVPESVSASLPLPALCEFDAVPIENIPVTAFTPVEKSESCTSIDVLCGNDHEISTCVVCDKRFKSKSCMNKHLRSVHTVKILTATKRPAPSNPHSKSLSHSSKRSQAIDNQSTITHTGSPVNPFTAKALASKLNERSNIINGSHTNALKNVSTRPFININTKKMAVKDMPVPPLISIQTPSIPHQRPIEMETIPHQSYSSATSTMVSGKLVPIEKLNDDYEPDLNMQTFNIYKKSTNPIAGNGLIDEKSMHNNSMHSGSSGDEMKMPNEQSNYSEKMHKCDLCGKKFNKKYELKRHKTVHENITYTCPYCIKVVKRKPSIIKHLRILHKDHEHIWNHGNFIETLKQNADPDDEQSNDTSPQTMTATISNSNAQNATIKSKVILSNNNDTKQNKFDNNFNNSIKTNTNLLMNKPKKSSAMISYLKKINYNNMKKYLWKNSNKTTEQFKLNLKLPETVSVIESNGANENNNINKNNNNNDSSSSCSSIGNKNVVLNNFVTNTPPLSPTVSNQSTLIQLSNKRKMQTNNGSTSTLVTIAADKDGESQKHLNTANSDDVNVNNIIDNCFFVDDTLNCNVVLHSPFSSDNDVDGFIMSNSNEDSTMNKELLNKFHDRLEEMEEKIDSSEFKVFWNEMLDDDNLNDVDENEDNVNENGIDDDIDGEDENDDDDDDAGDDEDRLDDDDGVGIEDSNDTRTNFNNLTIIKPQINEFA